VGGRYHIGWEAVHHTVGEVDTVVEVALHNHQSSAEVEALRRPAVRMTVEVGAVHTGLVVGIARQEGIGHSFDREADIADS